MFYREEQVRIDFKSLKNAIQILDLEIIVVVVVVSWNMEILSFGLELESASGVLSEFK